MIDSHCHLADKKFDADLDDVISRARDVGVSPMITIADTLDEGEKCIQIADKYEDIFCTVGVHPHASKDWGEGSRERLINLASSHSVKAIGEIGLDYHYDNSQRDVQREVFRAQLQIAQELDLPIVIHNREAIDDLKEVLKDFDSIRYVLHCCCDKWEDLEEIVDQGALLSFTGIATYPKSDDIRNTIANCPLDQLMIETDAPYLAPIPHRGKRNEPAFVVEVAKIVADVKGVSVENIEYTTSKNTKVFFQL